MRGKSFSFYRGKIQKNESVEEILAELDILCEKLSQDNYTAILLKVHKA